MVLPFLVLLIFPTRLWVGVMGKADGLLLCIHLNFGCSPAGTEKFRIDNDRARNCTVLSMPANSWEIVEMR
jgi:hypothetical protein